jgi:hypothetical protein
MYLLVIVTLVIGLISIYAQVLSLQAARYAANLTGMANTMVQWHGAAVSMGAAIIKTPGAFPSTSTPCSLTVSNPNSLPLCPSPTGAGNGTVTNSSGTYNQISLSEKVHLPPSYNTQIYQFYSVLYWDTVGTSPSNQPYVMTYVLPPTLSISNPAPGYLSLPALPPSAGYLTSLSTTDLLHQFSVLRFPDYAYGTVVVGTITPVLATRNYATFGTKSTQYNVPTGTRTGSVAIISSTSGF